jgi:hypothetical protein
MSVAGDLPDNTRVKNSSGESMRPRKRPARSCGLQRRRRASSANCRNVTMQVFGDLVLDEGGELDVINTLDNLSVFEARRCHPRGPRFFLLPLGPL